MSEATLYGFERVSEVVEQISLNFESIKIEDEKVIQTPLVVDKPFFLESFLKTSREVLNDILTPQEKRNRNAWFDIW